MSGIERAGGLPRPPGIAGLADAQAAKQASETGSVTAPGVLGQAINPAMLLGSALGMAPLGGVAALTAGLPAPRSAAEGGAPSLGGLRAASAMLEDSASFNMLDVTRLVYQANRQSRVLQRNDMIASMDAQANIADKMAGNIKSAAIARFTAAVTSAVVQMATSVASVKVASNTSIDATLAQAKSQAYSAFGGALGGVISAGGEVAASRYDAENKLLEAANNRAEKVYQEANSMLGDLKENMQIARDTIKALADAQMGTSIARNF